MEFSITMTGLDAIRAAIQDVSTNMPKEVHIAGSKTAKKGRRIIAKMLSSVIRSPQKKLMKATYFKSDRSGFVLFVRGKFRIALKHFKPKQTESGVTVNISKGRQVSTHTTKKKNPPGSHFPGAFTGSRKGKAFVPTAKFGGQPMRRVSSNRLPIESVGHVKPVSVAREVGMVDGMTFDLTEEYRKQLLERARFLRLKFEGKLRNAKEKKI